MYFDFVIIVVDAHICRSEDQRHARILQLAQFVKRNVDLWIYVPQVMNFGTAHDTIENCKGRNLRPNDPGFEELRDAKAIFKNW